jgi:O-antigen/teichoic acid export membrane protein
MSIINSIKSNKILSSIFVLLSGTIIAQLVPIALQPILRRSYSPEEFGKYALFAAVLEIIVTINTLRLEQAVLIPESDDESNKLVKVSIITTLIISFLVFPLIPIINYYTDLNIWYLLFLPFCSVFFGLINTGNYWFVRQSTFKELSINKLIRRFVEGVFHLFFGLFFTKFGLFLGSLFGFLSAGIHVLIKLKIRNLLSCHQYFSVLKEYKTFIFYSVIPSLLNIISLFIPLFIFKSKFDDFFTGQFDLTRQVLGVPLVIVSGTISQVLVSNVTNKFHLKKKFTDLLIRVLLIGLVFSVLLILFMSLFGVDLIIFIFGTKWKLAAELSQVLIWGYAMKFISTCFYNILIPINKVRILGWWQIVNFLISLILFIPSFTNNVNSFCYTYIIMEIVSCIVCLLFVFKSAYKVQKYNLVNE